MPFSSGSGKEQIKWVVSRLEAKTGLDIGCGLGTYAKLLPDLTWTGVEVWEPYVHQYNLRSVYPTFHLADARAWQPDGHWDIAVAGDVLEHMTREEAIELFAKLRASADTVIVSIPIGHLPQDDIEGNPYEVHVTEDWSVESVAEAFGKPDWSYVADPQWSDHGLFQVGVFVYCNEASRAKLKKPKICVYAIAKNEAHFIPRFCESAKDADVIVIADTGSTDGLPDVARQHGAIVHDICITPWRFDLARNAALALVPRDVDICISLDIDEMLQPGWREEMERVWLLGKTTRLRYKYEWSPGIQFYYEKIHARHGYRWHHPCHEYPVPDGRIQEDWAHSDMLMVVHGADPHKSRGFYLDLLELSVKEDPHCPRNAFYYARELSFNGRWRDSIDGCKRYLAMPASTWDHERAYAYRVIGKCHVELGEAAEAEKAFHQAASEAPHTREGWCELAMLMYRQGRWEECFAYSMKALKITVRPQVYTVDPSAWGALPHDLASISGWQLGLHELALQQGKQALALCPDDARMRGNVNFMEGVVARQALAEMGETPNIVHFLYFGGRPFSYVNYMAVRAAYEVQRPDAIYMHCTEEPVGNPNWEAIRQYVTLRKLDDITHFEGKDIPWPQYKSDIARIRILLAEGGIYLDNDMVLTKPIHELLGRSTVMSYESKTGHALSNAFIATPANSPFLKIWLERMASRINSIWADHSVVLSAELAHVYPDLVKTLPCSAFCPFYWDDQSVFHKSLSEVDLSNTYAIHLWDSLWSGNVLAQVDANYLATSDSAFASIFRKYATSRQEAA